jgi:hypothetical protein
MAEYTPDIEPKIDRKHTEHSPNGAVRTGPNAQR